MVTEVYYILSSDVNNFVGEIVIFKCGRRRLSTVGMGGNADRNKRNGKWRFVLAGACKGFENGRFYLDPTSLFISVTFDGFGRADVKNGGGRGEKHGRKSI